MTQPQAGGGPPEGGLPGRQAQKPRGERGWEWVLTNLGRIAVSLIVPGILFVVLWQGFLFLRAGNAPRLVTVLVAIVWGVGGAMGLFYAMNFVVERMPPVWGRRFTPYVFVGAALAVVGWYLLVPTLRSFYLSLMGPDSQEFVGLANYIYAFTSDAMLQSFRNNLLWLVFGTFFSVGFGLLIATLADRTAGAFEVVIKALIFMPMAISMVGASIIWRFVYEFRPPGETQIGLLNAIIQGLGGTPQAWLLARPWNNFFLIAVFVWLQTGFAMIVLSSALKNVPQELREAARIDGANEFQLFFRVTVPYIWGTIITVSTTVILNSLRIFDIVRSMTGGNYGTQVIANEQYTQMFRAFHYGRGSAIAIVLLIVVIPVMIYNLRSFMGQTEAFR
ncbi:MAG: carbohydrate ABC transporter permease [Anaerolineae bacterium]